MRALAPLKKTCFPVVSTFLSVLGHVPTGFLAKARENLPDHVLKRHGLWRVSSVTSHWAHLYGQMEQLPAYEPIAESKYAGEQVLRTRQDEFAGRGVRLIVMTGGLIEGTIAPKLLERTAPGLIDQQRNITGALSTGAEMGGEIALAAMKTDLPNGSTVVVGAPLQSMLLPRLPGAGP